MAEILDRRIEHYTFISSVSAYAGFPAGRSYDETAPLAEGNHGYGPLKARSEEALEAAFPGRVTHVRPGLIAGPYDPTDRFTYWPRRIALGGKQLGPGDPGAPVPFVDARDPAAWLRQPAGDVRRWCRGGGGRRRASAGGRCAGVDGAPALVARQRARRNGAGRH